MKTLIIQTSLPHTASTFLVNAIYGLIPELFNKKIIYNFYDDFENVIAIKTHNINIDELINTFNENYKLIFICSERKEKNYFIDEKYKKYDNVIIFDYNELNETNDNNLIKIVDNIYNKVYNLLNNLDLSKTKCLERIKLMNIRYNEIKDLGFEYIDDFFGLHGSHRNR